MSRPTVTQAEAWRPDALRQLADAWDAAARKLGAHVDTVGREVNRSRDFWTGSAADTAHERAGTIVAAGDAAARALVTAAVAARDGADQIATAQADVLARVAAARADGFVVGDDGSRRRCRRSAAAACRPCPAGTQKSRRDLLALRAAELTRQIVDALERLGAADADAAHDIEEAFASPPLARAAPTVPAGAWPVQAADVVAGWPAMGQDRIAAQIAAMTPAQRQQLIDEFPRQVGNTDGVPWDMRVAANRVNIAQAIVDERADDPDAKRRIAFYRACSARSTTRQAAAAALTGRSWRSTRIGRRWSNSTATWPPRRAWRCWFPG